MATVTKNLYYSGRGVTVNVDYDDVTLTVLAVHVINTSTFNFNVKATATATGRSIERVVNAGTQLDQNLPQNALAKLDITIDPYGRFDGVEWNIGEA